MTRLMPVFLLLIAMVVGAAGCTRAPSDLPELAPVSGTVTLDGAPVTNASVIFESANGTVTFGNTDASGKYELTYRDGYQGAEVGENTVKIETVLDNPPGAGYKDPIPAKYNRATELKVDVQKGQETHDFELKSR
ncbi:MAG: carboxypeptidase-like regulatory domain-containing protein [Pirellulaceae bacterium]